MSQEHFLLLREVAKFSEVEQGALQLTQVHIMQHSTVSVHCIVNVVSVVHLASKIPSLYVNM